MLQAYNLNQQIFKMDLPLNFVGTNQISLQTEYLEWLLNKSACYLAQEPSIKDISYMMAIVEKCLPFLGNSSFSPLWIVILDKIQLFTNRDESLQLYQKIDQEILRLSLTGDPAPLSVLLHLWQTNLPSLEFFLISVLQHMTMGSSSNSQSISTSEEILQKSLLIQASRHEPLILDTLQHMLMSLRKYTLFSTVVADILNILSPHILMPNL